jgi:hypothetical protein
LISNQEKFAWLQNPFLLKQATPTPKRHHADVTVAENQKLLADKSPTMQAELSEQPSTATTCVKLPDKRPLSGRGKLPLLAGY